MHEEMTIAIEVMSHTRRPAFGFTLEPEVWVFQLQRAVDLLERHRSTRLSEGIKDKHSIVVWRFGQIFGCVGGFGWIVG